MLAFLGGSGNCFLFFWKLVVLTWSFSLFIVWLSSIIVAETCIKSVCPNRITFPQISNAKPALLH